MVVKFPNKWYVYGRAREYRCMNDLRKQGALWVKRAYASQGLFDVWALFPDRFVAIQVKSSKTKAVISDEEVKVLREFARKIKASNIHIEIWLYHGRKKARIKRLT